MNFLFNSAEEEMPLYKEDESLLSQIQQAKEKLDRAWSNLMYAEPEYVDIAVVEVHLSETEYSLLNRKYRMIKGQSDLGNVAQRVTASGRTLPWLFRNRHNGVNCCAKEF